MAKDVGSLEMPEELEAREFLSRVIGLSVERVRTEGRRTADYRVEGDRTGYLVEVKSRNLPREVAVLGHGEATSIDRSMTHDDTVGSWLADAKAQMRTLDPEHERLWFLWGVANSGVDGTAQARRIVATLYGIRSMVEAAKPHRQVACYYAHRAAFARFPEVDGVVVYTPSERDVEVSLNLNEFSPRLETVKKCQLTRVLESHGLKPTCPSLSASSDEVVVPAALFEREGEAAVLQHVQGQTGFGRLVLWTERQYMGALGVDPKNTR